MADQAVSSLSNLATSVAIASQVDARAFGAFGVAFVFYVLVVGSFRAALGETLLVRPSGTAADANSIVAAAIGLSGMLSVFAGLFGWLVGGDLGTAFFGLAAVLPSVLVQDALRYVAFSSRRPTIALAGDVVWVGAQAVMFAAAFVCGSTSLLLYMLLWGLSATISTSVMWWRFRPCVRISELRAWLSDRSHLWPRFFAEYLCVSGVQQSAMFVLALFGGLAEAGGYRAAQVMLGPANVVALGAAVVVLPAASTLVRRPGSRSSMLRFSGTVSLLLGSFTAIYVLVLINIPSDVGGRLLGDSWAQASSLFLLCGLLVLVSNISYGATVMIRASENASASLRLRLIFIPFTLVAIIVGAWMGGATAMVMAMVSVAIGQSLAWWALYGYLVLHQRRLPATESLRAS